MPRIEWKSVVSKGREHKSIKLPLFSELGRTGRDFIDIVAEEDSEIYSAGIRTDKRPDRTARLTFGICTRNQEAMLLKNLGKLVQYAAHGSRIEKIIVVNQGGEFRNPQLHALMEEDERIECINMKDGNGFARTWSEGLANSESVYHILMADNVEIDPQIITNLAAFISYLDKEMVIGVALLDLLSPFLMYRSDPETIKSNGEAVLHLPRPPSQKGPGGRGRRRHGRAPCAARESFEYYRA